MSTSQKKYMTGCGLKNQSMVVSVKSRPVGLCPTSEDVGGTAQGRLKREPGLHFLTIFVFLVFMDHQVLESMQEHGTPAKIPSMLPLGPAMKGENPLGAGCAW